MTDLRTAAQQALEALDGLSEDAVCQSSHHAKKDQHTSLDVCPVFLRLRAAITALRAALAEPPTNQCGETCERAKLCAVCARGLADGDKLSLTEPVAYSVGRTLHWHEGKGVNDAQLFAAPPQRKPLSDADLAKIWDDALDQLDPRDQLRFIARAIERAHGVRSNDA